jgi:carbon monoxide dehydrogenase subunit G
MELTHSFTVPVGVDRAFEVLTDIERIAPCMPGATIDSVDGREFTGRVKVKVGPMQITYRGKARYEQLDAEQHKAVIEARGQETRGSGTANATITANLTDKGDETEVTVISNLSVTGRPAQFGRGVMNEVGAKLLGQFANCLSDKLSGSGDAGDASDATEGAVDTTGDVGSAAGVDQTAELAPVKASPESNGSPARVTEHELNQAVGAAPPQPAAVAEASAVSPAPQVDAPQEAAQPAAGGRRLSSPEGEAIDLFDVAGPSIAKRLAPVAIVVLILLLLWRRRRS